VLASGYGDRKIRLWDTSTGVALRILEGHGDMIYQVAFDSSGLLASASRDKTVKLWGI